MGSTLPRVLGHQNPAQTHELLVRACQLAQHVVGLTCIHKRRKQPLQRALLQPKPTRVRNAIQHAPTIALSPSVWARRLRATSRTTG